MISIKFGINHSHIYDYGRVKTKRKNMHGLTTLIALGSTPIDLFVAVFFVSKLSLYVVD